MKRVLSYVLTVLLAVAVVPLATSTTAGAIPGTPALSAPADAAQVTSNPVLSWGSVLNATSYRVQVSTNASFTPLLVNVITVNTKYGPPTDLPLGTLYWRVAAIDGSGQGGFRAERSFDKQSPTGPELASPADNATLDFPDDPPVFSWQPFPGAKRYEIEIDNEDSFTAPLTLNPTTTNNTSYTLTTPPSVGQNFYWRVRAFSAAGVPTEYSEIRHYSYAWPDVPTLQYPPNDNSPSNGIEEVVFQWTPAGGAVTYDLQVSPTDLFTSITHAATVKSTRYSPPITINNGAYFWRVRARNFAGAVGGWSEISTFYRAWPAPDSPPNNRVALLTPTDDDVSSVLPEFSWTPVRLASLYSIELSDDEQFSPGNVETCTTQHTSFIPTSGCMPTPGSDYYWRVKPIDGPKPVNGLYSPTFRFQYNPGLPTPLSPADGATGLTAPVELTWAPVANGAAAIAQYRVTILKASGTAAETSTTYATGYVPQNLNPADGPFSWYVRVVTAGGDGIIPAVEDHFHFSFAAPTVFAAAPDPITPDGTSGTRMPHLEWQPVSGATSYEIWRAVVPSTTYSKYSTPTIKVGGYTDAGISAPGSYTYFIRAKAGASTLADGNIGTFIVESLAASVLQAPAHCGEIAVCAVEPDTPTFEWTWDPQATHYLIYLAADPNFTNILGGYNGVRVVFPRYRPTTSLPDAQAGQATYWYARPCAGTVCGAGPEAFAGANPPIRAFLKRSNAVQLVAPASQATGDDPLPQYGDQITFDWEDYLATNLADPDHPSDQEARNYQVDISTTADMQTVVHSSALVDQTTYTTHGATLPDGPLYWRVTAFDQAGNTLTSSAVWLIKKRSPIVSPLTPADGASASAVPLFTWASQDYAARYVVEVYKNPGQTLATANRVLTFTTPMTAWTPATSLPAGDYGWRIRRLDVDGRPGTWTAETNDDLRLFSVTGNQVSLITPDGTNFANNNQSFSWTAAPSAAQYRFQTSTTSDFATTKESQVTVMTSWHSTISYLNGAYFWRVQTLDGGGNTTATSLVRSFTHGPPPPPMDYFHPLTPARILDSRPSPLTVGPFSTKWGAGQTRSVAVAGFSGVPAGADAVTLNVTVTGTTAASFLKIWPKGQPEPTSSSLNWGAGSTIANSVTMTVGTDESVSVKNQAGSTNVIIDVVGYYDGNDTTGGGLTSLTPKRILDTRPIGTVGPYATKFGPGVARDVEVAGGTTGIPAFADAVVLNVTATGGTAGSFLTIWPKGETQPTASSVNFAANQTIPNAVTTKVGTGGDVRVFNNAGSVNVIVDIMGYFEPGEGSPYRPLANPVRIQDSRPNGPKVGPYSTKWNAGTDRAIQAGGNPTAGTPGNAVAVLLNVTVTGTTGTSFLTVYPDGAQRPNASSLNWTAGTTIPNSVTAKTGTGGRIRAHNASGSTDVIMDVFGYYGP